MRAIDVDALKKDLNMADNCDECPLNWKECEYGSIYSKKDFCQWLDDAPTIEPITHWIPCNEMLPEENGQYLVQFKQKFFMVVNYYNGMWNATKYGQKYAFASNDVVAWMPLPEAYGGKSDE